MIKHAEERLGLEGAALFSCEVVYTAPGNPGDYGRNGNRGK